MGAVGIQHEDSFQDRLKRVKAGGVNTNGKVYVGTPKPKRKHKRYEVRESKNQVAKKTSMIAMFPVHLISGLLIGAGAVMLARYLRFRLDGGAITGANADLLMGADIVLAITFAIILKIIFRFHSRIHGLAKLLGVLATVLLMQNAVHIAPELFEKAYSVQWVNRVLTDTRAETILLAGVSYDFELQKVAIYQKPNVQPIPDVQP